MKKYVLIFNCFLGINIHLFSQDNIVPADFNILPPSPVAAGLGSFNALNNSMHTGKATASINLLQLESSFMNIPISANYASNGVNLDDIGGDLGINWSLLAGGVISRTVRDQPDENSHKYIPNITDRMDPVFLDFLRTAAENPNLDTEPDLFNFNFLGYSGKFVLDHIDETPQILDASIPLEIYFEREGTEIKFKVLDDAGVEYQFGFGNAFEKTRINYQGSNCGRNYDQAQTTSWYLNKIISPNGQEIIFNYNSYSYSYVSGKKEIRYQPQTFGSPCGNSCPIIPDTSCEIILEVPKAAYLSSIVSDNNSSITFDYRASGNQPAVLSNIFQNNAAGAMEMSYDFSYHEMPAGDGRVWLTNINQLSVDNKVNKEYEFEYYKLENLPSRLSNSRDHYGFFNGAGNSALVPNPFNLNVYFFGGAFADRSANPNYSYYGMLKSITYPTKGKQTFKYEPNTILEDVLVQPPSKLQFLSVQGEGLNKCHDASLSFTIHETQTVSLGFKGGRTEYSDDIVDHKNENGIFILTNEVTAVVGESRFPIVQGERRERKIKLKPGTYTLKIEACSNQFELRSTVSYYTGESYDTKERVPAGGNRVSYIESNDGKSSSYQYFIYAPYSNLSGSSGVTRNKPQYLSFFKNSLFCNGKVVGEEGFCSYAMLSSNSLFNLNSIQGNAIVYRNVITGKSDKYLNTSVPSDILPHLNGFTENTYYVEIPSNGNLINGNYYFGSAANTEVKPTGLLKESTIYAVESGIPTVIKKVENKYTVDERVGGNISGFAIRERYTEYVQQSTNIQCGDFNNYYRGAWQRICLKDHTHTYIFTNFRNTPTISKGFDTYYRTEEDAERSRKCLFSSKENHKTRLVYSNPCYNRGDQIVVFPASVDHIDVLQYSAKIRWYYLEEVIETTYTHGEELKKITKSNFGNTEFKKKSKTTVSVNQDIISESYIRYPYDYLEIDEYSNNQLLGKNIVKPVKVGTVRNNEVTNETLLHYDSKGNITEIEQAESIDNSNYSDSELYSSGVKYYKKNKLEYNDNGQIISNSSFNGLVKKYEWDGNKRLVAEVTHSKDLPFFVQTFDENGSQDEEMSLSGSGYKKDSYYVNFSKPSSEIYLISYYQYLQGQWNHILEEYDASFSISGERIDQVCIFPAAASAKFFTYSSNGEMDAIFDSNGNVTFYEYDEFNRLKKISDSEKNILKTVRYNYKKNQSTN